MPQLLPAADSNLAETAAALTQRRSAKPLGARIPEALWSRAVALASTHGVAKVARVLRLDYVRLKRRLLAEAGATVAPPPGFVEMTPGSTAGRTGLHPGAIRRTGRALRIAWMRPLASEVAAVARSLWEAAP